jgi:hypothetical protein
MTGPTPLNNVSVTLKGVTRHETYYVQNSIVYVRSAFGSRAAQVGGSPPLSIATLLLLELVRGGGRI